jgi:hypothetical protein
MSSSKNTKCVIIATGLLLLLLVIPTIVGNSSIQFAAAQTTTTSSSTTHQTFHAKGVVGNLVLTSAALQSVPPPEAIVETVVGGEWRLDVVNGQVQNFTVNMMSVDTLGKNFEKRDLRDLTNVQPVGSMSTTTDNATAGTSSSSGNSTSQGIVLSGNSTSFTGTVTGVGESGTNQQLSVTFNLINGNLANIWLQSSRMALLESPRLPIFGVTTSLTDENGNSLLEGRT